MAKLEIKEENILFAYEEALAFHTDAKRLLWWLADRVKDKTYYILSLIEPATVDSLKANEITCREAILSNPPYPPLTMI